MEDIFPVRFRCPECGSSRIARIQWGRPSWDEGFRRALREGRVVLGSCFVEYDSPKWECRDCHDRFGEAGFRALEFASGGERMPDHVAARRSSSSNRGELESSSVCGCFHCGVIFHPSLIEEWMEDAWDETAVCPFCGVDSVIGDRSGWPIKPAFLERMRRFWFADGEKGRSADARSADLPNASGSV